MPLELLWIGAAGAVGALCRYWLSRMVAARWPSPLPAGTLVINVTGSFCLGLLLGAGQGALSLPDQARIPIAAGFLGSYTTFSTFSVETVRLYDRGSPLIATANVVASVVLGLLAAGLGLWTTRFLP